MKNSRICPKCEGEDILLIYGSVNPQGDGNYITTGITRMSAIPVNRYLCCSCGYSEEWIAMDHIPKLKKKFGE